MTKRKTKEVLFSVFFTFFYSNLIMPVFWWAWQFYFLEKKTITKPLIQQLLMKSNVVHINASVKYVIAKCSQWPFSILQVCVFVCEYPVDTHSSRRFKVLWQFLMWLQVATVQAIGVWLRWKGMFEYFAKVWAHSSFFYVLLGKWKICAMNY